MRKIKAFCSIVLVIASVVVFSLVSVPEVASAYTPTEEDKEYIEWILDNSVRGQVYGDLILDALNDADFDDLEMWYGKEYDFYKESLEEIEQFDVSPELQPIKNEYKLALQDLKQASYYGERWAKYLDSDDADKSISYRESGIEHMKKTIALSEEFLSEFTTPSPTTEETPTPVVTPSLIPQVEKDSDGDGVPNEYDYAPNDPNVQTKEDIKTPGKTPGFGAIFAIGSLLAVAYLVLRRKR